MSMGLENRDYYRDGSYTETLTGWGLDFTPVVKYLILANVAVFLLQIFITRPALPELPPNVRGEMEQFEQDEDREPAAGKNEQPATRRDRQEKLRKPRQALEEMLENMPG